MDATAPLPTPMPLQRADFAIAGAGDLRLAATRIAPPVRDASESPLLFAHGFGQTRRSWNNTMEALAQHGRASIAYDARGHGDSARNPADLPYDANQFADDLIIVAGEMPRPPVLIGASMGGLFGLVAEARWPGLFEAMVLVDVTPRWEPAGLERILAFMTAFPDGFASLQAASDAIALYLPHRSKARAPAELREALRRQPDDRWHWHWDARMVEEFARDSARHQDDLIAATRAVQCPVLLVSGGKSDLVSRQTIAEFREMVPHATHIELPDATHMVAGDDNDAFTATVLHYLAGLDLPGDTRGSPP